MLRPSLSNVRSILMFVVALTLVTGTAGATPTATTAGDYAPADGFGDADEEARTDAYAARTDGVVAGYAVATVLQAKHAADEAPLPPTANELRRDGFVAGVSDLADRFVGWLADLRALVGGDPEPSPGTLTAVYVGDKDRAGDPVVAGLGAAAAVGLVSLLVAWARRAGWLSFIPLFSRIEGSALLKHPMRAQLVAFVEANPGHNASEVARSLDLAWGTATHHLDKLVHARLLAVRRTNNQRCYFVPGAVDRRAMDVRSALKRPTARRIAEYVGANPASSQKQIAAALGLSRAVTSFHVRKMAERGVVQAAKVGKESRVTLTDQAQTELALDLSDDAATEMSPAAAEPAGLAGAA